MSYLKNNPIKEFVKGEIIERLADLKGYEENQYICDLGYTLFESENVNGAYFCNNYTAKEWVNKNFEHIGEIAEEIKFQFDSDYANKILLDVFDNPDRLIVVIVLEVSSYLISRCQTAEKHWNKNITLTDKILDNLIKEIKEL